MIGALWVRLSLPADHRLGTCAAILWNRSPKAVGAAQPMRLWGSAHAGGTVKADMALNERVYGPSATVKSILGGEGVAHLTPQVPPEHQASDQTCERRLPLSEVENSADFAGVPAAA